MEVNETTTTEAKTHSFDIDGVSATINLNDGNVTFSSEIPEDKRNHFEAKVEEEFAKLKNPDKKRSPASTEYRERQLNNQELSEVRKENKELLNKLSKMEEMLSTLSSKDNSVEQGIMEQLGISSREELDKLKSEQPVLYNMALKIVNSPANKNANNVDVNAIVKEKMLEIELKNKGLTKEAVMANARVNGFTSVSLEEAIKLFDMTNNSDLPKEVKDHNRSIEKQKLSFNYTTGGASSRDDGSTEALKKLNEDQSTSWISSMGFRPV